MPRSPYDPEFDSSSADRAFERAASAADDAWTDGEAVLDHGRKLPEFKPTRAQRDALAKAMAAFAPHPNPPTPIAAKAAQKAAA